MVFGDQGHGVKPENLPVAKPGTAAPGKALNTKPTAAQSVWGIEHRRRQVAIKKASCPEGEVAGEFARGADAGFRLDQASIDHC